MRRPYASCSLPTGSLRGGPATTRAAVRAAATCIAGWLHLTACGPSPEPVKVAAPPSSTAAPKTAPEPVAAPRSTAAPEASPSAIAPSMPAATPLPSTADSSPGLPPVEPAEPTMIRIPESAPSNPAFACDLVLAAPSVERVCGHAVTRTVHKLEGSDPTHLCVREFWPTGAKTQTHTELMLQVRDHGSAAAAKEVFRETIASPMMGTVKPVEKLGDEAVTFSRQIKLGNTQSAGYHVRKGRYVLKFGGSARMQHLPICMLDEIETLLREALTGLDKADRARKKNGGAATHQPAPSSPPQPSPR